MDLFGFFAHISQLDEDPFWTSVNAENCVGGLWIINPSQHLLSWFALIPYFGPYRVEITILNKIFRRNILWANYVNFDNAISRYFIAYDVVDRHYCLLKAPNELKDRLRLYNGLEVHGIIFSDFVDSVPNYVADNQVMGIGVSGAYWRYRYEDSVSLGFYVIDKNGINLLTDSLDGPLFVSQFKSTLPYGLFFQKKGYLVWISKEPDEIAYPQYEPILRRVSVPNSSVSIATIWWTGITSYFRGCFSDQSQWVHLYEKVFVDIEVCDAVETVLDKATITGSWATLIQSQVSVQLHATDYYGNLLRYDHQEAHKLKTSCIKFVESRLMKTRANMMSWLYYSREGTMLTNQFFSSFGSTGNVYSYFWIKVFLLFLFIVGVVLTIVYYRNEIGSSDTYHRRLSVGGEDYYWVLPAFFFALFIVWLFTGVPYAEESLAHYIDCLELGHVFHDTRTWCHKLPRPARILKRGQRTSWPVSEKLMRPLKVSTVDPVLDTGKFSFHGEGKYFGSEFNWRFGGLLSNFSSPSRSASSVSEMANKAFSVPPMRVREQCEFWALNVHTLPPLYSDSEEVPLLPIHMTEQGRLDWIMSHTDGGKVRVYLRGLEKFKNQDYITEPITEVFPKVDETLHSVKSAPRPIFNASPAAIVETGPVVDVALGRAKLLHGWDCKHWNRVETVENVTVHFKTFVAVGSSYLDLGRWADNVINDPESCVFHSAQAGDDAASHLRMKYGKKRYEFFFETDYTQYDGSQGVARMEDGSWAGPLENSIQTLETLGMTSEVADRLRTMRTNTVQIFSPDRQQRVKISFPSDGTEDEDEIFFQTGKPETTANNTLNNEKAHQFLISRLTEADCQTDESFSRFVTDTMALLGFKVKIRIGKRMEDLTFLKGRFLRTRYTLDSVEYAGFIWHPDPGLAVKFGIAKVHPSTLFPGLKEVDSFDRYLSGVAQGWKFFPRVPILHDLCDVYHTVETPAIIEPYKPSTSIIYKFVRLETDYTPIYEWYDSDEHEFSELAQLCRDSPAHTFINHKLIRRLEDYLYGDRMDPEWY
jgi:hypothetical protein